MTRIEKEEISQKYRKALEYTELKKYIVDAIGKGELRPHAKLSSERELSKCFNINRNTVRYALKTLEWEDYIYRSVKRGWYVRGPRLVYDPSRHLNFFRLVSQQSMIPSWKEFKTHKFSANKSFADMFKIDEGDPLYLECGVGAIDGQKAYYAETFLNAGLCADILPKIKESSITDILKKEYNIVVKQIELLIRPIRLNQEIKKLLDLPLGTPGLYIMRKKSTQHNEIIEIDNEYWRYDAIELKVDEL